MVMVKKRKILENVSLFFFWKFFLAEKYVLWYCVKNNLPVVHLFLMKSFKKIMIVNRYHMFTCLSCSKVLIQN